MFGQHCIADRWQGDLELRHVTCDMAEDLATFKAWEVSAYDDTQECDYWCQRYPGN
ncbi:MAG: hypothetical protein IPG91_17395 [Ideonella sp.]|nr:hypothetical protein [Ideonella sp.]